MIPGSESIVTRFIEGLEALREVKIPDVKEWLTSDGNIEKPDIAYIERTARTALFEQNKVNDTTSRVVEVPAGTETKQNEGLTDDEKAKIKEETGWPDEIIACIRSMEQYKILKYAHLIAAVINGRPCLIKENIDLDYKDADGLSNRDRIARGLAPLDSKTGKPIELHHLGQKADSPLVELTEEEHRTGVSADGTKNQSIWHDNSKETEVHGEGNNWDKERQAHWKSRSQQI
jgi:hypothetical protein